MFDFEKEFMPNLDGKIVEKPVCPICKSKDEVIYLKHWFLRPKKSLVSGAEPQKLNIFMWRCRVCYKSTFKDFKTYLKEGS